MAKSTKRSTVGGLACLLSLSVAAQADWPSFRGPRHDGISDERGFRTAWTEPIPMVWDKDLGAGFSSFACVGDRVFTAGTREGQQVVFCLRADTGETVWERPLEEAYAEPAGGDGPRATPTVDEGRVYMLGARGRLACLDAVTGDIVWQQSFQHMPQWGYSGSVLIEGNLAITSAGKSQGALVAFHKLTGEPAWKAGDDAAGYATPYPFTFDGTRYVVGFTGTSAVIVEAASGQLVWRLPWKTDWDVNASSPIFHDGHLFLSSGYQTGCGLFKLRKNGSQLSGEEVWRSDVLMNKFQSCVLHEGKLYSSDQKALVCADFLTGKEHWRKHRIKHGTVLLADGHILLLTQEGTLQIAPASPEGFEPVTTAELLTGRCWTVPVLHRGKLYVRNLERAACFDLSGRGMP